MPMLIISHQQLKDLTDMLAGITEDWEEWRPLLNACRQVQENNTQHIAESVQLLLKGYERPMTLDAIKGRYQYENKAQSIPREWMYMDIGILCGWVEQLQHALMSQQTGHYSGGGFPGDVECKPS